MTVVCSESGQTRHEVIFERTGRQERALLGHDDGFGWNGETLVRIRLGPDLSTTVKDLVEVRALRATAKADQLILSKRASIRNESVFSAVHRACAQQRASAGRGARGPKRRAQRKEGESSRQPDKGRRRTGSASDGPDSQRQ